MQDKHVFVLIVSLFISIVDEFIRRFVSATKSLVVGVGINEESNMGPLITKSSLESVVQKVSEALEDGADLMLGGNVMSRRGNFFEPTILANTNTKSGIWQTETFGPVAAIISFTDETEAIDIANDTLSGLAAYIMTKDTSRIFRLCAALQNGLIGVNEGVISSAYAPFGGLKESGLGREGASVGIDEYTETKYIFINH